MDNTNQTTDADIINLFFDRDENAITVSETKYGTYCRKISMNILNNISDTSEILNDTWLKAWNTIPPNTPNPLKPYFGLITRTLSINRYQYNTAQKRNSHFDMVLSEV